MMFRGFLVTVAALFGLVAGSRAEAQPSPLTSQVASAADRILGDALRGRRINAAAVVFVDRGRVTLARTYGFEDLAAGVPVDAARTRLPIGSVSKVFTGLAISQLISEGRIGSVDDPVNRYVKGFQVPGPNGRALTLRHLLTHTSGFEERIYGTYAARLDGRLPTARDYLKALPPFSRPPGGLTAYSNSGAALLGAVIEGASGERYGEYLQRHVFAPAGMTASLAVYRTPVAHQVKVYDRSGPRPRIRDPIFCDAVSVPAGGLMVSADDMGRFMAALLAPSPGPMNAGVVDRAFQPLHATHPGVQAHAMLFETIGSGPQTLVHHGGSLPGSQSWLFLAPGAQRGLFVFISDWQVRPPLPFEPGFWSPPKDAVHPLGILDAAIPLETLMLQDAHPETPSPAASGLSPADVTGVYRSARRVTTTMMAFASRLFPDVLLVGEDKGGGLTVNGQGRFLPIGPALYADAVTGRRIGFARTPQGGPLIASVTLLSSDYVKASRWEDPRLYLPAWWLTLAVSLTGMLALVWPGGGRWERVAKASAVAAAACAIAVPVALFAWDDSGYQVLFGGGVRYAGARFAANAFLLFAPALVILAARAAAGRLWPGRRFRLIPTAHLIMLALAAAALLGSFAVVNFLGWRYP